MSRAFLIKKNNTAGEYGKSIMIDTGTPVLLCELTELGVCILTMNRPAGRNSIGDDMTPFIRHMLHILKDDDRVRCLVITGAGGAFSAGGNFMGTDKADVTPPPLPPAPDGWKPLETDKHGNFKQMQRTLTGAIYNFPVPTIAALPGAAAGAGASIALACDMRVASTKGFITTAYVDIGLTGDYGGTYTLTELVGPAKAKELAFTNTRVYGEEGERLGIFNQCVPDGELMKATMELANKIADKPPQTVAVLKDNINFAVSGADFLTALDHEGVNLRQHTESKKGQAEFAMMRQRFQYRMNARRKK